MPKHDPSQEQFTLPISLPEPTPPKRGKVVPFPIRSAPSNGNAAQTRLEAQKIYALYPYKVARPVALRAIEKALRAHSAAYLIERTQRFSELRGNSVHDLPHVPHPSTWYNQERFADDESTWLPYEAAMPTPAKRAEAARPVMPSTAAPAGWDRFLASFETGKYATYRGSFRHAPAFMQSDFSAWRRTNAV